MKQLPDALIIVDMQDYFLDQLSWSDSDAKNRKSLKRLVGEVIKQATWAMKHNVPILVLEYDLCDSGLAESRTTWAIRKVLRLYKKKWYAAKQTDDGANEVLEMMHGCEPPHGLVEYHRQWNLAGRKDTFTFRICGVNMDACVWATTRSLVKYGHKVHAVHEATRNTYDPWTTKNPNSDFNKLRRRHAKLLKIINNVA